VPLLKIKQTFRTGSSTSEREGTDLILKAQLKRGEVDVEFQIAAGLGVDDPCLFACVDNHFVLLLGLISELNERREKVYPTGKRVPIACSRRRCCPNLPFMTHILSQEQRGYLAFKRLTRSRVFRANFLGKPISYASVNVTVYQSSG